MFVKICGITNREDALAAMDAGARALGFIFYGSSPRCVTVDQVAPWMNEIPPTVWKVGVFVDEEPALIEKIMESGGLDIAQLHGSETPELHPRGVRIWKAFRVADSSAAIPDHAGAEAILIDGAAYDWTGITDIERPLILAGGLDPDNVQTRLEQARRGCRLRACHLWGVDVASGVEVSPRRKDYARMKRFIEAATQA